MMGKRLTKNEIYLRILKKCESYNIDCSKVEIRDMHSPITLICKIHGEYTKTPHLVLYKSCRCPKCSRIEGSKKLSEIGKTKVGELNNFYGKHHTEKTKEKLRNRKISKEEREKISIETRKAMQRPEVKENIKKSMPGKVEKIKNTSLKKFGKTTYTQTDEFKKLMSDIWANRTTEEKKEIENKARKTKKERYGSETFNNREKAEATCLEKYDTPIVFAYGTKEFRENMAEKYGENYTEEIAKKSIESYKNNVREFEIENECIAILKVIEKYGQGWLCIKDETKIIRDEKYGRFIPNSELHKIEYYFENIARQPFSLKEKKLFNFISKKYKGEIIENCRSVISPYEIDIFIPEKKIAIEFNGAYFHSELRKPKDYHLMKSLMCEKKGVHLIHIYEWELKDPYWSKLQLFLEKELADNIKTLVDNITIKEISKTEACAFLSENSLYNVKDSQIYFGVYKDHDLFQVVSFYNRNNDVWEISNLCMSKHTNIEIEIFNNILSQFVHKFHPKSVLAESDFNKVSGKLFEKVGMKLIEEIVPNEVILSNWKPAKEDKHSTENVLLYGAGIKKFKLEVKEETI